MVLHLPEKDILPQSDMSYNDRADSLHDFIEVVILHIFLKVFIFFHAGSHLLLHYSIILEILYLICISKLYVKHRFFNNAYTLIHIFLNIFPQNLITVHPINRSCLFISLSRSMFLKSYYPKTCCCYYFPILASEPPSPSHGKIHHRKKSNLVFRQNNIRLSRQCLIILPVSISLFPQSFPQQNLNFSVIDRICCIFFRRCSGVSISIYSSLRMRPPASFIPLT